MQENIHYLIEKAIEGNYKNGHFNCSNCANSWKGHKQTRIGNRYCALLPDINALFLDPLFFQALGKVADIWKNCGEDCSRHGYHKIGEEFHRINLRPGKEGGIEKAVEYLISVVKK